MSVQEKANVVKRSESVGDSQTWGLINVTEAASRLKVSVSLVRRLIAQKRLPHRRLGRCIRIHPDDLDEFIEEARVRREDF